MRQMQPNSHSGQCPKKRTYIQTRRVGLDNRQGSRRSPRQSARLFRLEAQSRRVTRTAEFISQLFKNARYMVHMSRDAIVFLKMEETTEQMAEALGHRQAPPRGRFRYSIVATQMHVNRQVVRHEHRMDHANNINLGQQFLAGDKALRDGRRSKPVHQGSWFRTGELGLKVAVLAIRQAHKTITQAGRGRVSASISASISAAHIEATG